METRAREVVSRCDTIVNCSLAVRRLCADFLVVNYDISPSCARGSVRPCPWKKISENFMLTWIINLTG